MLDLYNKIYSRETLKKHIYSVRLIDILKSQKLDTTFIVRYILNPKYQLCEIDEYINVDTVLLYQKHINKKEIEIALLEYNSDDDSIDDFETVSKKND
jgi:HJR/Mrr/RecB family endonuclease